MAKLSLLDMTQNILSAMSSDQVSNIDDTTEAIQVAEIIRETYEELMSQRDWPHLGRMVVLESLSDSRYPTTLYIPAIASEVHWIKYNKKKHHEDDDQWEDLVYLTPEEFVDLCADRRSSDPTVETVHDVVSGVPFMIYNNRAPNFYTTFDEKYIVADSINRVVDDTLRNSKTQAFITKNTEWSMTNEFIPDLPEKMFPLLLADAKDTAMINLKQAQSNKEVLRARRQNNTMQHRAARTYKQPTWNNYGRKRR